MDNTDIIRNRFQTSIQLRETLFSSEEFIEQINEVNRVLVSCFKRGNSVWFCGNGGSAADAQHLAAEFSGRYYYDRPPLPSEALNVNTSYLTAVANDYGYNEIFARLVEGIAKPNDVLIGLSTSGKSKNVLRAFEVAKNKGLITIAFLGNYTNDFQPLSDYIFSVPSSDTPRIQELHITIGHILCELVEKTMFPKSDEKR